MDSVSAVTVDNGSLVGIADCVVEAEDAQHRGPVVEVAEIVANAVAAGILGNLGYDALKTVSARLGSAFVLRRRTRGRLVDIRNLVVSTILNSGHATVEVHQIRQLSDESWEIKGTSDGLTFLARADAYSQLVYINFDGHNAVGDSSS